MEGISLCELRLILAARVGLIVKATREDLDMTQERLAGILGWTRAMVANVECGRRTLTFADFVVISSAFNIEPERMLRRMIQW